MRVLIVEDEEVLARALQEALQHAGMVPDVCHDGHQAQVLGCVERYDAAVLDLGLPGQDGLSTLRHWREQGQHFSVLVLTARSRWSDKLDAFQAGADDYLTKPFLEDEVVTRLRVLHRRHQGRATPIVTVGPLRYDTIADRFQLDERHLTLTAQEQRILAHLIQRAGQVVSRADIAEHVYARDLDPDSNTLDVLIGRIRRKLSPHTLIHTERGRGYRLSLKEDPDALA